MNDVFKYRAPTSRAELFSLLAAHGEGAKLLAGAPTCWSTSAADWCSPSS